MKCAPSSARAVLSAHKVRTELRAGSNPTTALQALFMVQWRPPDVKHGILIHPPHCHFQAQNCFCPSRKPGNLLRGRSSLHVVAANDAEPTEGNNLFSTQFMGVLQQSLARQGAEALTKGIEVSEESKISAVEEVLATALNQSKHTLRMLQQWRNQIDAQIAAQEKQVDRMEFALSKARNDAALLKTLKAMVYEQTSD